MVIVCAFFPHKLVMEVSVIGKVLPVNIKVGKTLPTAHLNFHHAGIACFFEAFNRDVKDFCKLRKQTMFFSVSWVGFPDKWEYFSAATNGGGGIVICSNFHSVFYNFALNFYEFFIQSRCKLS